MKTDPFDLTTLLILAVAVIIFLRLRSVLGRRTGNERPRPEQPSILRNPVAPPRPRDNVVPIARGPVRAPAPETSPQDIDKRLSGETVAEKALQPLREIAAADPAFNVVAFVNGAKLAYEMIVTAYANGDRETLRNLLSREVYDSFGDVISEREGRGEKTEFSFVGFVSSDIVDAHMMDRAAQITVRFVTDLVTAVRDRGGEVVEGDLNAVRQVTDVWTFTRDVTLTNPNWRLVATDAP